MSPHDARAEASGRGAGLHALLGPLLQALDCDRRAAAALLRALAALDPAAAEQATLVLRLSPQDVEVGWRAPHAGGAVAMRATREGLCSAIECGLPADPVEGWRAAASALRAAGGAALDWLEPHWPSVIACGPAVQLDLERTHARDTIVLWLQVEPRSLDELFKLARAPRYAAKRLLDTHFELGAARAPEDSVRVGLGFAPERSETRVALQLDTRARPGAAAAADSALDRLLDGLVPAQRARVRARIRAAPGRIRVEDGFVELGFEAGRPPLSSAAAAPRPDLHAAVHAALEFLSTCCDRGCFRDFLLPAGVADAWPTAYVAFQLQRAAECVPGLRIGGVVSGALAWLARQRRPGAAWGYHTGTQSDADSTALAIHALRGAGRPVPGESVTWLRTCLSPDGGVATYPGARAGDGYCQSHVDVTPIALAAMEDALSEAERRAGVAFLQRAQTESGLWESYWWLSPLYPSLSAVDYLVERGAELPRRRELKASLVRYRSDGPFELALQVQLLDACGDRDAARALASELMHAQLPDGSWPASAFMRLTHRQVLRPALVLDAGPLFEDPRRVFTTATAMVALARVAKLGA